MKKRIRYIASLMVLLGVVGMIGTMTSVFADEEEEGGYPPCNCVVVNAPDCVFGRSVGNDCLPNPCWVPFPIPPC